MTTKLTDAERWELIAKREAVTSARLRLAITEAAQRETSQRIAVAHGLDPAQPFEVRPDGTLAQAGPRPVPSAETTDLRQEAP